MNAVNKEQMYKRWNHEARQVLVGRTIKKVMYMNDTWAHALGFEDYMARPLMMELDDGTLIIPLQDDEGNGGGAIEYIRPDGKGDSGTLPVLP